MPSIPPLSGGPPGRSRSSIIRRALIGLCLLLVGVAGLTHGIGGRNVKTLLIVVAVLAALFFAVRFIRRRRAPSIPGMPRMPRMPR